MPMVGQLAECLSRLNKEEPIPALSGRYEGRITLRELIRQDQDGVFFRGNGHKRLVKY